MSASFCKEVWNKCLFFAVMIPLDRRYRLLQQKYTSHRPYVVFYTLCVLLRAMPRTFDPDVDTPRVNVDQQGEKRHKNVSSGRVTHHVVLFYYGSIATASHPPHAKCKIFQTVSVRHHNWFLSFFAFFFTHPPSSVANTLCTTPTQWPVWLVQFTCGLVFAILL